MQPPYPTTPFLQTYGRLFDGSDLAVLVGRPDGGMVHANAAACRALGRSEEEICRLRRHDLVVPDEAYREGLAQRERHGLAKTRLQFRRADGTTFPADVTSTVIPDPGGDPFTYVLFRDVSAQVESERKLREATEALHARELDLARLHGLDGRINEIELVMRLDGSIVHANDRALHAYGYTWDELRSLHVRDLRAESTRDAMAGQMAEAMERGIRFETEHRRKDGSCFPVRVSCRGFEVGGERYLHSLVQDLTEERVRERERRSAEEQLRLAHLRLQQHLTNTPLAIIEWDGDHRVTRFNGRAEAIFGWSAEEVVGKRVDEVPWVPEEDRPIVRALTTDGNGAIRPTHVRPSRSRRKDGSIIHCEWYDSVLRGPDGRLASVFSLVQDVTARERAKAALQESEQRFRAVADSAPLGIFLCDVEGNHSYVNPAYLRLTGLPALEALGRGWVHVIHPEDRERVIEETREAVRAGHDLHTQHRFLTRSGKVAWVRTDASPIREPSGAITGYVGVVADFTAERLAARALRASEARLRSFFSNPVVGIAIASPTSEWLEVNDAFCRMLGYPEEELRTRTWPELTHPDDVADELALVARIVAGEIDRFTRDKRYLRRDGSILWTSIAVSCVRAPDRSVDFLIAHVNDIGDRKRAEEALRASEERYRSLVEVSPDAIVIQRDGVIEYANPAGARLAGVATPEQLVGRSIFDLVHPDWRDKARARADEVMRGGTAPAADLRLVLPDGSTRDVQSAASRFRDARGPGVQVVMRDVTEQLAAQQQLVVASRLAALGTLVAGVGHEINNPLAAAMASDATVVAELKDLQRRLDEEGSIDRAQLGRAIAGIVDGAEAALEGDKRIARIVRDLVAFTRTDTPRERLRLREVAEAAIRWLPETPEKRVIAEVEDHGAPEVLGQRGQVAQVLLNLLGNASRARRQGTIPRVTVRLGPGRPGMARLEVTDDGVGMPPEVLKRIFDPFYSTREPGEGMGLGLSICHAIVTGHGGTISAASEPGQGSTFTIELPAAPEAPGPTPSAGAPGPTPAA